MPTRELTARQHEVLEAVTEFWKANYMSPSVRDLCQMLGIASPNGVTGHLRALRKKGFIRYAGHRARTITPNCIITAIDRMTEDDITIVEDRDPIDGGPTDADVGMTNLPSTASEWD